MAFIFVEYKIILEDVFIIIILILICTFRRIRLFTFYLFFERRLIPTLFFNSWLRISTRTFTGWNLYITHITHSENSWRGSADDCAVKWMINVFQINRILRHENDLCTKDLKKH